MESSGPAMAAAGRVAFTVAMTQMDGWLVAMTVATAVGCGLVGGVFLAFSSFVMTGLRRLPPPQAVAAMQAMNASVPASLFGFALMATAAACLALVGVAVAGWGDAEAAPLLVGAGLYLGGAIALTAGFHIPRNNALDAVDATGPEAPAAWARYVGPWLAGNHVRTVTCAAATAILVTAVA
jgi:uncharacterized membrane protein